MAISYYSRHRDQLREYHRNYQRERYARLKQQREIEEKSRTEILKKLVWNYLVDNFDEVVDNITFYIKEQLKNANNNKQAKAKTNTQEVGKNGKGSTKKIGTAKRGRPKLSTR